MSDSIELVRKFHEAFEIPNPEVPVFPGLSPETSEDLSIAAGWLRLASSRLHKRASGLGEQAGVVLMRAHLMTEELAEVLEAMADGNPAQTLHELGDLRVVTDGTTLALGLARAFNPFMDHLMEANMSKLGPDGKPIKNEAGRVVKGPNFKKADALPFIQKLLQTT